jgi:imidazolonepropionase
MHALNRVELSGDRTTVVVTLEAGDQRRIPLRSLISGVHLLAHPGSRLEEATLAESTLELRLADGSEHRSALDRHLTPDPPRDDQGRLPADLVVRGGTVLTGTVHEKSDPLGLIPHGAVACWGPRVVAVGAEAEVLAGIHATPESVELNARGGLITPGLVDPHTHVVFGGDRSGEFALRAAGATYQEIAAAGGGIRSTVQATRDAEDAELEAAAAARVALMVQRGVTTAEAKSGYDLTSDGELRLLEVIGRLGRTLPMDLSPTLLGAHVLAPEYADHRAGYVDLVCETMIPTAARHRLAEAVDVYCDPGAFTLEESRRILETARAHGLARRIHAEQFENLESAGMAARLGAVSADHLEAVSKSSMKAMASAGTVAVLLPGAALTLDCPWPPADALVHAGVDLALGTDLNPGTSMTENLHLMMSLGCMKMGLTVDQAWAAVLTGAARAACRPEAGRLAIGGPADLVIFDCAHHAAVPYHLGGNHVKTVIKAGRVALER